jgi:DNA gyrase subunit A
MADTGKKVIARELEAEIRDSYMDYAMSVIISRALPDVRDGLKPVQRRILVAMRELGAGPTSATVKCAKVCGDTMGNYHPHGAEENIYPALVRMAQDFNARYPLIEGQGNMGSVDGDPPAAMRYTEVRMSPLAMEVLEDLEKETVDFQPNFDESRQEPVVLPGRFPNLLCNGGAGIAVGMATNIPPHNLGEVVDALAALIDDPEIGIDALMKKLPGPDFPTGGIIVGRSGIAEAYRTGRGHIVMQGRAVIEELPGGKQAILITELPYQVNKSALVENIARLVREKRLEGISDIRDESDRTGMRVVVELKRDANANVVLNHLWKHTALRSVFGVIMLALVDGAPRILNLKQVLQQYVRHRKEVVTRRTRHLLARAQDRVHLLEGFRKALDHIDEVITIIRGSKTRQEARQKLEKRFKLSERQSQAIVEMQLGALVGMERQRLEEEHLQLLQDIARYEDLLASERLLFALIKEELAELKKKHADERRTRIQAQEAEDIEPEELIAQEDMAVSVTRDGYIKRMPLDTYRVQGRGGRGILALTKKEEDSIQNVFVTSTHHTLLFFTSRGKAYHMRAFEVPVGSRQARGTALVNMLALESGEKVTAVVNLEKFDKKRSLVMVTRRGTVKRTALVEFETRLRTKGITALTLDSGDELDWVKLVRGDEDVLIVTAQGQAVRFPLKAVRLMGRTARGVRGVLLRKGDQVVGVEVPEKGERILVASEKGNGKRTPFSQYRRTNRGTQGVKTLNVGARTGKVVGVCAVKDDDEVMLISAQGILIRQNAKEISSQGRATLGVRLMRLEEGDSVKVLCKVVRTVEMPQEGKSK